jgi:hypothetical protein
MAAGQEFGTVEAAQAIVAGSAVAAGREGMAAGDASGFVARSDAGLMVAATVPVAAGVPGARPATRAPPDGGLPASLLIGRRAAADERLAEGEELTAVRIAGAKTAISLLEGRRTAADRWADRSAADRVAWR